MAATTFISQTALEALVISQLTDIKKREDELQKRISGSFTIAGSSTRSNFDEELWQLQQRTDRLNRMMDAMGGYSS